MLPQGVQQTAEERPSDAVPGCFSVHRSTGPLAARPLLRTRTTAWTGTGPAGPENGRASMTAGSAIWDSGDLNAWLADGWTPKVSSLAAASLTAFTEVLYVMPPASPPSGGRASVPAQRRGATRGGRHKPSCRHPHLNTTARRRGCGRIQAGVAPAAVASTRQPALRGGSQRRSPPGRGRGCAAGGLAMMRRGTC